MNGYELLIPQITLLIGIIFSMVVEVWGSDDSAENQWRIQLSVLILALIQQVLLYRMPPALFLRGGMILDGTTQFLSICVLLITLIIHLCRKHHVSELVTQTNLLVLGASLLSLFSLQTNRFLFGIISIVGLVWVSQAALATDVPRKRQSAITHSGMVRGMMFLLLGTFLTLLCFSVFGETQIDEIQRVMARPIGNEGAIYAIQLIIIFLSAIVMGVPPFQGAFGSARIKCSWPLAIGFTGIFSVVGLNLFFRWALLVFSRPGVGGLDLEPLATIDVFLSVRIIAAAGLVLTPLLALLNTEFRRSLLFFILNPFVQVLFALSFGHREVMGFALGQVLTAVFILGVMTMAIEKLNLPENFSMREWIGIGRKDITSTLFLLSGITALSGLSPFYGSMLIQKTLCINSWFGVFLLINVVLTGYYVTQLATMAFQKPAGGEIVPRSLSSRQKFLFVGQFMLLIFMGIFWQPLYKYGAFSIRTFFGDL